ncbi:hypothetical protein B296_00049199 [Ensete ventricosum]|uniref:Kinesin motor domain-containing protein n=1 Tax=Ensete ventricosum TaxID=4639 RepID=A0A426XAI7_ENSVE|nr:hypothetical protein B296_00049199 [Ensete ventricosum]
MGTIGGDEASPWEKAEGTRKEERILVSVRLRPLNAKEIGKNDPSDWECRTNTTIVFKNAHSERTMYPTAYTFGTVVEKLTEETLRDRWHLKELLCVCEGGSSALLAAVVCEFPSMTNFLLPSPLNFQMKRQQIGG